MWEWRVFGDEAKVPTPRRTLEEPRGVEERSDLYFLVQPHVGLKLRAFSLAEKCELKLRYERDPDSGIELWEKVYERKLPLAAEWLHELGRFLGAPGPLEGLAATSARELGRLCEHAGLGTPRPVLVRKRIAKAPCPPAYTVESVELELSIDGGPTRRLRSIAVEAPTLELCRRAGEELGFPRADSPGLVVAGYPEALGALLQG